MIKLTMVMGAASFRKPPKVTLYPAFSCYACGDHVGRRPDDGAVSAETCSKGKRPPEHAAFRPGDGFVQKEHYREHGRCVRNVVHNRRRDSRHPQDEKHRDPELSLTYILYPVRNDLKNAGLLSAAYNDKEHDEKNQRRPFNFFFQKLHNIHLGHQDDHGSAKQRGDTDLHVEEPVEDKQENNPEQHGPAERQDFVVSDPVLFFQESHHLGHVFHFGLFVFFAVQELVVDDLSCHNHESPLGSN